MKTRTITLNLQVLRGALTYAQQMGMIASVPTFAMPHRKDEKPAHRWHTREQMEKVIAAAPNHTLLLTMAYLTGMRKSELLTREWSDIDLERGIIRVTHKERLGFRVKMNRERVIPACPRLLQLLNEVPKQERYGLVFTYRGDHIRDFKVALKKACKDAGVPHISPHDTRKTFASLAMMDGLDISTIAEIGGWANHTVLLEIYAHVSSDHVRRAMAGISFGQVKESTPQWESPAGKTNEIVRLPSTPTFQNAPPQPPYPSQTT